MDIRAEVVIAATPQAVWAVIGEQFGRIGEWASPIITSTLDGPPADGSTRLCQIGGFGPVAAGVIHEQLTTFHAGQMTFCPPSYPRPSTGGGSRRIQAGRAFSRSSSWVASAL